MLINNKFKAQTLTGNKNKQTNKQPPPQNKKTKKTTQPTNQPNKQAKTYAHAENKIPPPPPPPPPHTHHLYIKLNIFPKHQESRKITNLFRIPIEFAQVTLWDKITTLTKGVREEIQLLKLVSISVVRSVTGHLLMTGIDKPKSLV